MEKNKETTATFLGWHALNTFNYAMSSYYVFFPDTDEVGIIKETGAMASWLSDRQHASRLKICKNLRLTSEEKEFYKNAVTNLGFLIQDRHLIFDGENNSQTWESHKTHCKSVSDQMEGKTFTDVISKYLKENFAREPYSPNL